MTTLQTVSSHPLGVERSPQAAVLVVGLFVLMLGACTNSHGDKASLPPKGTGISLTAATDPAAKAPADSAQVPVPAPADSAQVPVPAPADSAQVPVTAAADSPQVPVPAAATGAASNAAPLAAPAAVPASEVQAPAVEYRLTGQVAAPRHSQLAFRVQGFMQQVVVKAGMSVKKGEVLATLEDRDFIIRVELAKARRDLAKVGLDDAEKEHDREIQLKKESASTATTFDKVKAAFDSAKLNLRLAQLELDNAELALKDTKLTAPYDCVVAQQLHDDAEYLQTGTAVFEVYDVAEPEITFSAPERLFGQVAVGGKLSVAVPSANYVGKAQVIRLVPVITEKTRTFQVTAKLEQFSSKIAPGSYAEATLD